MRSKFAIMGHPLHPMLVTLPIGLFLWAFVADIVYIARDHEHMWYSIAFWSGIAAWVTALVAALPASEITSRPPAEAAPLPSRPRT